VIGPVLLRALRRLALICLSEPFLRTVDDWRRSQIDIPSRAEAIRRMVELASKMKTNNKSDADR
jgi:hypothetical protein